MRFFSTLAVLAPAALVSAAPTLWTRQSSKATIAVLQFAELLEELEAGFYQQALQKFQTQDFITAGLNVPDIAIQGFADIQQNEAAHASFLLGALQAAGQSNIRDCRVDFGGALDNVATMAATARVLELVGVGAYIGGAELVGDPQFLVAAASILTIEARHQTFVNTLNGASSIPQAFDLGLTPGEVLTIASAFVSGCDVVRELDFAGLGLDGPKSPLQVSNRGPVTVGTRLTFSAPGLNGVDPNRLSCQMMIGGLQQAISLPANNCIVPNGINGPVLIFLTASNQPLSTNVADRLQRGASDVIVAGPTIAFIDSVPDTLGALVRNNGQFVQSSQIISAQDAVLQLNENNVIQGSVNLGNNNFNNNNFNGLNTFGASNDNNPDIVVIGVTVIDL